VGTFLDFPKLAVVLGDAYADLFGTAPHIENENSTRNLLAERIVALARTGETNPEWLKQYALAGFVRGRAMITRPMRFRVLRDSLVLEGISLPPGDYNGEISWSEHQFMGRQTCVRGPSRIEVTRSALAARGDRMPSITMDATSAVKRGDIVVL